MNLSVMRARNVSHYTIPDGMVFVEESICYRGLRKWRIGNTGELAGHGAGGDMPGC
ncbi:hypothetical protein BGZ61DRAFT_455248 [Ilyonectria robusta]|uniref:uncharacterized protein n=1 Tax=Ilyonectria robusta TaxID=1079257 RepID=UPI001E8EAA41|nr:uncharacterized protein BGZ61DRAFT_455248 [Ilyonectria robusta]KAH8685298.1 hypothetical protein BGZ61DRAFT_455248 [Ilyonectria robusta]